MPKTLLEPSPEEAGADSVELFLRDIGRIPLLTAS